MCSELWWTTSSCPQSRHLRLNLRKLSRLPRQNHSSQTLLHIFSSVLVEQRKSIHYNPKSFKDTLKNQGFKSEFTQCFYKVLMQWFDQGFLAFSLPAFHRSVMVHAHVCWCWFSGFSLADEFLFASSLETKTALQGVEVKMRSSMMLMKRLTWSSNEKKKHWPILCLFLPSQSSCMTSTGDLACQAM